MQIKKLISSMIFQKKGQTLVTLLVFVVIATAVTASATAVILNTSQGTSHIEGDVLARDVAEAGIENALIRLVRDPSYTGEMLPVDDGTAVITVTGVNPKTVTSVGTVRNYVKTVEVIVTYTGTNMTVSSWQEKY